MNLDSDIQTLPAGSAAPAAVPAWAWLVAVLALAVAYLVMLENGAIVRSGAAQLHELFHDGRHFFGRPCH